MLANVLTMADAEEIEFYMREQLLRAGLGRVVPTHRGVVGGASDATESQSGSGSL